MRIERGNQALQVMETHLATRPFFVADRYTIADIALYAYTHVGHEADIDLTPYKSVQAWLARVASQPRHIPITQG
jgi:glutathione S-transferase